MNCGKRCLQKQIKKQKELFVKRLNSVAAAADNCVDEEVQNVQHDEINDDYVADGEAMLIEESFKDKLKKIFVKHKVSRSLGDDLLSILPPELKCPKTTQALFGFKKNRLTIRTVAPGKYIHFGLKWQLKKISSELIGECSIVVDIGIDGLSMFKSTNKSLWPILCKTTNLKTNYIFIIGAFYGNGKPRCINSYLHDLNAELQYLLSNGFQCNDQTLSFSVRAFICDAPARAFVTGTISHNAFHGCSRCLQEGKKINGVTVFSSKAGISRTDESFRDRSDPEHHNKRFRSEFSDLEAVGIKMVSQFPIDPMHLIHIGITKKMLSIIYMKLKPDDRNLLNQKMKEISKYACREFARKPRTFEELSRWKATELRQFILYTGIVALKDILSDDDYYHFLLLHTALRLLYCPYTYLSHLPTAQSLINEFVNYYSSIYGEDKLTYNVHNVLHIVECVTEIGLVTEFSAFPFENFMLKIKKQIKKPNKVLEQLKNSFYDAPLNKLNAPNKPLGGPGVWVPIKTTFAYFNPATFEKYVSFTNSGLKVIVKFENEKLVCKSLVGLSNFYNIPVPSSRVGIHKWEGVINDDESVHDISDIFCKFTCLPLHNYFVLLPMLHNCF